MDAETSVKQYEHKIKQICSDFLGNEWSSNNNNIAIQRILTGGINKTFRCTLNGATMKDVIVKFYRGELLEKTKELSEEVKKHSDDIPFNSEVAEILVIDRLASRGMAPKLYGLLNGGRIEEFIQGRNPTISDFEDKTLFATVAHNLAKYHTMQIPILRKCKWLDGILKLVTILPRVTNFSPYPEEHREGLRQLFDVDIIKEFNWTVKLNSKINCPMVFSHNSMHMCNMILRENYGNLDDRIMLIDYKGSFYNYRGYDLAYFITIFEFTVFPGVEKVEVGYSGMECREERKIYFMEEYLSMLKNLKELDREIDTVEHLRKEIALFQLQVYLVFMAIVRGSLLKVQRKDFCTQVGPLLDSFAKKKEFFLSNYPNFN